MNILGSEAKKQEMNKKKRREEKGFVFNKKFLLPFKVSGKIPDKKLVNPYSEWEILLRLRRTMVFIK